MKKLYVGNIPFKMEEQELRDLFGGFGEISEIKVIMDRETNRPKGFAFVSFSDDAAADKAITDVNGREVGGRAIVVNVAREKGERPAFTPRERQAF